VKADAASGVAPAAGTVRSMPTWVYAGWGFGTLAPALVLSLTNILLLRFMTDHVGLSAAVGAALIAFSKIYDAVTDPLGGLLSDKTRSRWGRRRPWLLAGTLMLALALVALFWGPAFETSSAAAWYMGAMLIFYATAYSAFSIPYMAMPAEMTQGYHDRSYLMSFRIYAVGLAGLAASAGGPALIAGHGEDRSHERWIRRQDAVLNPGRVERVNCRAEGSSRIRRPTQGRAPSMSAVAERFIACATWPASGRFECGSRPLTPDASAPGTSTRTEDGQG
jgi:hypothetical protein